MQQARPLLKHPEQCSSQASADWACSFNSFWRVIRWLTCIKTVEAMPCIGIVVRLWPLVTDVVHDFVLPLSGRLVARQDDFAVLPKRVSGDLAWYKVLELLLKTIHEAVKIIQVIKLRSHEDSFLCHYAIHLPLIQSNSFFRSNQLVFGQNIIVLQLDR